MFEKYELSLYSAADKNSKAYEASALTTYGLNRLIRDFSSYPSWLPLPCHYDHAPIFMGKEDFTIDLKTRKKLMLLTCNDRARAWKECSSISCMVMGSMFVHYRHAQKIKKSNTARGTVIFPGHSTGEVDSMCDCAIQAFCKELAALPQRFHPITICLHWNDICRGKDKIYRQSGFDIVTAGNGNGDTDHRDFAKKFYTILSQHAYTASNEPGSYVLYAIEMGLPFFWIGKPPVKIHFGTAYPMPARSTYLYYPRAQLWKDMFDTGPVTSISNEQKAFIDNELGVGQHVTPKTLKRQLLRIFLKDRALQLYTIKVYMGFMLRLPARLFKKGLKKVLNYFGYTISKKVTVDEKVFKQNGFLTYHNAGFVKSPDFVRSYQKAMSLYDRDTAPHVEWKVHVALWAASYAKKLGAAFVECSVNRALFAHAIFEHIDWNTCDNHYFLYGQFCDADLTMLEDDLVKSALLSQDKRIYYNCFSLLEESLSSFDNVHLKRGTISESIASKDFDHPSRVGFLLLDLNESEQEIKAAEFFLERMIPGGIILLDNYASTCCESHKTMFDQFAAKQGLSILSLPTGQGMCIV